MKCSPRPKAHWKKWVTNKWVHIFGTDMLKTLNERSKQYWQIRKTKWVPGSDSLNNKFLVSHHDCLPLRLKHHFQEISKEPPYSLALNIICLIISSTVSLAVVMQPPQPHNQPLMKLLNRFQTSAFCLSDTTSSPVCPPVHTDRSQRESPFKTQFSGVKTKYFTTQRIFSYPNGWSTATNTFSHIYLHMNKHTKHGIISLDCGGYFCPDLLKYT